MPYQVKNHSDMAKCVCAVCFRTPKTIRNITPRVVNLVKDLVLSDFGEEKWDWLPSSICSGCYKNLHDCQINPRYLSIIYNNNNL